ncbi:hypothetical protein GUJ93_ZPchr0005g15120 [Zizania palustris]|uniref:Photosystem I assembly factor PSA3, chloroplastic n=1 Tax=Zizania palustris TaxID=103762 RepID=A0A8J5T7D5_ZIZPA|nr:hypothetical protein GUJ93_ZPchr0005g15120 [Zizania palustris]
MGTLSVAHRLSLASAFLPRHRRPVPCASARRQRLRRRHGAVVAYMEPNPNSPASIAGRLIGALPVVGLVARILSDEGGVGGDMIDFAEFRRRVSKKCTVMDSQAFYDFNERRGKTGDPFYVLLCCWLAAVGGGLLKTEEILEGVARLRLSNDIEFEEETFLDMMKTAKEVKFATQSLNSATFLPENILPSQCIRCCVNWTLRKMNCGAEKSKAEGSGATDTDGSKGGEGP